MVTFIGSVVFVVTGCCAITDLFYRKILTFRSYSFLYYGGFYEKSVFRLIGEVSTLPRKAANYGFSAFKRVSAFAPFVGRPRVGPSHPLRADARGTGENRGKPYSLGA